MENQATHSDKDNKTLRRKIMYSKTSYNLLMLFSMIIILIGFLITTIDKTVIGDAIIGSGILISGYGFMKLTNK
jgi:hypothetical protein